MGRSQAPQAPRERSYFQEFAMKETTDSQTASRSRSAGAAWSRAAASRAASISRAVSAAWAAQPRAPLTAPVVFVGYGISEPSAGFDELKGMNLKGKIVLLLSDAPGRDDPKSPLQAKKELKDKYFPAAPQGDMMAMMMRGGPQRFNKLDAIAKLEPAAIVQVSNTGNDAQIYNALSMVRQPSDERPIVNKPRRRLSLAGVAGGGMGRGGASATQITREMANFLLEGTGQTIDDLKKKIESTMKPASMDVPGAKMTIATTAKTALVRGTNVLGDHRGLRSQAQGRVLRRRRPLRPQRRLGRLHLQRRRRQRLRLGRRPEHRQGHRGEPGQAQAVHRLRPVDGRGGGPPRVALLRRRTPSTRSKRRSAT